MMERDREKKWIGFTRRQTQEQWGETIEIVKNRRRHLFLFQSPANNNVRTIPRFIYFIFSPNFFSFSNSFLLPPFVSISGGRSFYLCLGIRNWKTNKNRLFSTCESERLCFYLQAWANRIKLFRRWQWLCDVMCAFRVCIPLLLGFYAFNKFLSFLLSSSLLKSLSGRHWLHW